MRDEQPLRILYGKRFEQNGAHHVEDGGVGADAEGERQDRDGSEGRTLA